MRKVFISDVSLKHGGEALSFREKAAMARLLESLGADAAELPEIKNERVDAVVNSTISDALKNCAVKISVGLSAESAEQAWQSVKNAAKPCLQVSVPVSTVQMEYLCHKKAPKMLELIAELCTQASSRCENVEFNALDASRTEKSFLIEACKTAEAHGAKCVTICDDAGTMLPSEFAETVKAVKSKCKMKVFVQPSDSISMALACGIAAIESGADGVKTSIDGSAGIPLEKFADFIKTKGDNVGISSALALTAVHHSIDSFRNGTFAENEKSADAQSGEADNAGDMIFTAESTLSDVCEAVKTLGYDISSEDSGKVYAELGRVTQKKESVGAKELEAIIASTAMQVPSTYHLDSYVSNSGNVITSTAHITLIKNDEQFSGVGIGDGPIDAAFRTIEQIIGHHYELDDFQIQAVTQGREAMGSALVKLRADGRLYSGNGTSTDIIGASIRAYINALNKIVYEEN